MGYWFSNTQWDFQWVTLFTVGEAVRGGDQHHHLHAHHVDEGHGHPILPHLALSDHLCPLQREGKKFSPLLGTAHPQPRFSRPDRKI